MEPLISKWHRELELFSAVKPLLILEGNVLDQYRYPVAGSLPEDELVPLSRYLNAFYTDMGYEQVVFYSNLFGFVNPWNPEMVDSFADCVHGKVKDGVIPAELRGNSADTAPNLIRCAMLQQQKATVTVLEMASHYIVTPDRMDQQDVNCFNLLLQAAVSAATVRTPMGRRQNLLVLLVNKLNDLPAWFYLDNPNCKTITL